MFGDGEDVNSTDRQNPNPSKAPLPVPPFPQKPGPNHITRGWEAAELRSRRDRGGLAGAEGPVVPPKTPQPNLRVDGAGAVIPGEHPSPRRYTVSRAGRQRGSTSVCLKWVKIKQIWREQAWLGSEARTERVRSFSHDGSREQI